MSIIGLLLLVTIILNYLQKTLIDEYKRRLDETYKNSDEVLEYCLMSIIKHSVQEDVQDFETANRCQELIKNLKNK